MTERYELFLRREQSFDEKLLEGLPTANLYLDPYRKDGVLLGFDLAINYGVFDGALTLCEIAFAFAEENGFVVYDPQLAMVVTHSHQHQIVDRFSTGENFVEAGMISYGDTTTGSSFGTRIGLIVVALLVLIWFFNRLRDWLAF